MSDFDDGHSAETCNYVKCGAESEHPCPFLREDAPIALQPDFDPIAWDGHQHQHVIPVEWLNVWEGGQRDMLNESPYGWYVSKLRCLCGDEVKR